MTLELILQHANRVMEELGTGHREGIYARALVVSLNNANIGCRTEVDIPIMYEGQCVGHGRADMIVKNVIVEVKAVCRPPKECMGQIRKYVENLCRVERKPFHGIVLNFCQQSGTVSLFIHDGKKRLNPSQMLEYKPSPIVRSRFFPVKRSR